MMYVNKISCIDGDERLYLKSDAIGWNESI